VQTVDGAVDYLALPVALSFFIAPILCGAFVRPFLVAFLIGSGWNLVFMFGSIYGGNGSLSGFLLLAAILTAIGYVFRKLVKRDWAWL
jgi:hypothetical protein